MQIGLAMVFVFTRKSKVGPIGGLVTDRSDREARDLSPPDLQQLQSQYLFLHVTYLCSLSTETDKRQYISVYYLIFHSILFFLLVIDSSSGAETSRDL